MRRRELGKTGIQVSEIAFGGVEIGMTYGRGKMPSPHESVKLLRRAVESGINFFDTARLYGQSELLMGTAFRGMRDDVVLCTKCTHFKKSDGSIPSATELHRIVRQSLDESLAALETDYVDIFMVHHADLATLSNEDVLRVFSDLRSSGRAHKLGVSVYAVEETDYALRSGAWDVIQLPFNLLNQEQSSYFGKALEAGVGIVVRSVLMQGMLSEGCNIEHPALMPVMERVTQFGNIARNHNLTLPRMASKFALQFPEVSGVLVGIDRMEYLNAALDVGDGVALPKVLFDDLRGMAFENPSFLNLHHWKQQGWI